MNMNIHKYILLAGAAALLAGCEDEVLPTNVLTNEQVANMPAAQEGMLNGITSFMVSYNAWGASEETSYYTNDWGYPCQMLFRDV